MKQCDLGKAEVLAHQMRCRDGSAVLFALRAHRCMFHSIVAIMDVNMSGLANITHGDIPTVGAEGILAARAKA